MTCARGRPCIFPRRWRPISPLSPFRIPASRPCRAAAWDTSYGLKWPRQVYGRLVEELSAQGAKAVAFDVLFGELRPDHPLVQMADGSLIESDDFFALQCRLASNVILAATPDLMPPELFATNALALGDITTEKDSDGVLAPRQGLSDLPPLASALPRTRRDRIRRGLGARHPLKRAKSSCRRPERPTSLKSRGRGNQF